MNAKSRKIAAAIMIGQDGSFLLQLRDDKPGLLFAGMIGLFGGHREKGESFIECAMREIEEETGFKPGEKAFEPLVKYRTRYPDDAKVKGSFYVLKNVPEQKLVITEGTMISVRPNDLPKHFERMTPATCFVVKTYLDLSRGRD